MKAPTLHKVMRFVLLGLVQLGAFCAGAANQAGAYDDLRQELRAFYPDLGQGWKDVVKDARQPESYAKIERELKDWCAEHPGFDALDQGKGWAFSSPQDFSQIHGAGFRKAGTSHYPIVSPLPERGVGFATTSYA